MWGASLVAVLGCGGPDLLMEVVREEGVGQISVICPAAPCGSEPVFEEWSTERQRTVGVYRTEHARGPIVLELSSRTGGSWRRDRFTAHYQGAMMRLRVRLKADRCLPAEIDPPRAAEYCRAELPDELPANCASYVACAE